MYTSDRSLLELMLLLACMLVVVLLVTTSARAFSPQYKVDTQAIAREATTPEKLEEARRVYEQNRQTLERFVIFAIEEARIREQAERDVRKLYCSTTVQPIGCEGERGN